MRLDEEGVGRFTEKVGRAPRMRLRDVQRVTAPTLLVMAALVGLPLAYGVSLGNALLYVGYELCYIVIPGWLVYRALSSRPGGRLRQFAIGWGLGYVLEVLAFMLTAAAGVRYLLTAYPLIVGIPAAWALRRKGTTERCVASLPVNLRWAISGVCVIAAAYVALSYFPAGLLPGGASIHYPPDLLWAISLASEALHHWPIRDPNVAGLPMPYHFFVHVHLASASQVTGLSLPLVFLRLYLLPLIVLAVLQVVIAGESLARSPQVGIIAACLLFLVGQVDLLHFRLLPYPFLGVFFTHLYASPSIPFGLVMLLPLLILVGEAVSRPEGGTRLGDWVLILVFMIGASDAKIIILPMIVLSLFLFGGGHLLVYRRIPRAVFIAAGLACLVFGAVFLLQYRGYASGVESKLSSPIAFFTNMSAVSIVKSYITSVSPSFPGSGILISGAGVAFGVFGLFGAQMIGLVWLFTHTGIRLSKRQAWLLSFFCTGLVVVFVSISQNVLYFLDYGIVAGCILSADGLHRAWSRRPRFSASMARKSAVLVLMGAGLLGAVMTFARFHSASNLAGIARTYVFAYGTLAVGIILLVALGSRLRHGRWVAVRVATAVIVMAGFLYVPLYLVRRPLRPVATVTGYRITPQLYRAMAWIRDHTPEETVIGVNNAEALDFDYAAFSERRTFLGGWGYSLPSREHGYSAISAGSLVGRAGSAGANLFARRVSLNNSVFHNADRHALRVLTTKYGVRYLLIDELNGFPANLQALHQVAQPVYRASSVVVLKLE